jgi:hypothetical protein
MRKNKQIMNNNIDDIKLFFITTPIRSKNDSYNKEREIIINNIINNKIADEYYKKSVEWITMKNEINLFIKKLCDINKIITYNNVNCVHKAGRNNHYDFKLIIDKYHEFYIEFKFNTMSINNIPQFVSPMHPSQYLEKSYEEYYYDNYFTEIVKEYELPLPDKNEYLKQIHSTAPKCLIKHQLKYYNGCKNSSKYTGNENDISFYEKMKEISNKSINNFIFNNGLKINELTEYLLQTQQGKYYMLYKDNKIYLETINQDDYIIIDYIKEPKLNKYIAITKTNKRLNILLRWKNGNGIAFPAFQIS